MAKQLPEEKLNEVATLVAGLHHPLVEEINLVRSMIKGIDSRIAERVKWNAPSYYLTLPPITGNKNRELDFLTIHVKNISLVHLIFHHPAIVLIESSLLEGDYKDRRMVYLKDKAAILQHQATIVSIIRQIVKKLKDDY